MKLPLGLLLEECIPECDYTPDLNKGMWVQGIQILEPDAELQNGILYIALDDCKNLPEITSKHKINVLAHAGVDFRRGEKLHIITIPDGCDLLRIHNRLQTLFSEFREWFIRLTDACAFGCRLQELLNLTECMTPNHIYIADMSFRILAYTDKKIMPEISATWRYQLAHGYLPVHVMKGMIETKEFETLNGFHRAKHFYSKNFNVPFVTKNIFYNNRPQAHLFVVNAIQRPCFRDIAVAQLLGEFIERHYFILDEFKLNRNVSNHEAFFGDVLRGVCTDEGIITRQISLFDWHVDDSYCMAVIRVETRGADFQKFIMYQLAENPELKCFIYEGNLVILLNRPQTKRGTLKNKLVQLSTQYTLEICFGHPYAGFLQMGTQYHLLVRIMEIARRYQSNEHFYEASDYNLLYIIDRVLANPEFNHLWSPDAVALREYDRENDTDYFPTYLTYLLNDRNVVHTSKALHIHRNTLMYRLDKIHELVSLDEEKYEQRLHMLLSMLLLKHQEIIQNSRPG